MAEACLAFELPVVGGNVSLYNEMRGRDIHPTPIVGVLGLIDALRRRPPGLGLVDGGAVLLVGGTAPPSLAGSRWAWDRGATGGALPVPSLQAIRALAGLVRGLVADGVVVGAHDVAEGGLVLALAELAVTARLGLRVEGVDDHVALFGESTDRVVICVDAASVAEARARAEAAGVPLRQLGTAGGDRLVVGSKVDVALGDATAAWRDRLPAAFGTAVAH
jgi:phosphoribosylformylglycinamidine (FGAM) synthase-like enzyme